MVDFGAEYLHLRCDPMPPFSWLHSVRCLPKCKSWCWAGGYPLPKMDLHHQETVRFARRTHGSSSFGRRNTKGSPLFGLPDHETGKSPLLPPTIHSTRHHHRLKRSLSHSHVRFRNSLANPDSFYIPVQQVSMPPALRLS